MKIKEVTLNDLNEVISLEKKLFKKETIFNKKEFKNFINDKKTIFYKIEDDEQQLVGYVIAEQKEQNIKLHRIAINKDQQRQGFGSLLLAHVEALDLPITAYVDSSNLTAINFFEVNKFSKINSDSKCLKYEKQPNRKK